MDWGLKAAAKKEKSQSEHLAAIGAGQSGVAKGGTGEIFIFSCVHMVYS